ncbi:MAG: hypothetical protein FWD39_02245 [Clostridiales bacterium]|nr:hypothetical protein [Clostridiales bacterium]
MTAKKRITRIVTLAIITLFLCMLMPLTAQANSSAPANSIYLAITNKPEAAVHADILIKIGPGDAEYVDFNSANGEKFGIAADSQIAMYNEDGYMSFTFHYLDSASEMMLKTIGGIDGNIIYYFSARHADVYADNTQFDNLLANYHVLKIALLDEHGNILCVSGKADINPQNRGYFVGRIDYNADNGRIHVYYSGNGLVILLYIFFLGFAILRMAFSIAVETLVAIPFKIRPLWKIISVNAVTQIILIIFMAFSKLPYIQTLIIIEVFVYLAEFGAYTLLFKNIPKLKLLLYTVVANTASLLLGLLLPIIGNLTLFR